MRLLALLSTLAFQYQGNATFPSLLTDLRIDKLKNLERYLSEAECSLFGVHADCACLVSCLMFHILDTTISGIKLNRQTGTTGPSWRGCNRQGILSK